MDYHYHAIILGKRDIGEADRLYTAYTFEAGKIKVKANGVRKPSAKLAGIMEPITQSEIFVARVKGTGRLTGAIASQYFSQIKNDWESLQEVFFVFRHFEKVIAGEDKDEGVFFLLQEFLETLEKNTQAPTALKTLIALGFLVQFFQRAGYQLEADKCVLCQTRLKAGEHFFSAAKGGALCGSCQRQDEKAIRATTNAVKIIRLLSKNSPKHLVKLKVTTGDVENVRKIVEQSFRWIG